MEIGKAAVRVMKAKHSLYHAVSHEVHDGHVAKFTVFIVLKPPMEQLYQVNKTCVVSSCSNRKLHMPGRASVQLSCKARVI